MSAAAVSRPAVLPCQRDPDRWFDGANRTQALAGCLSCPARARCAREALAVKPSSGMWAGIWIDHNLADVAHYLRAIAEDQPQAAAPLTPLPAQRIARPRPRPELFVPRGKHTAPAAITARSSGHCEIMTRDCSLRLDTIASRIRGRAISPQSNPAFGYAVCRQCDSIVRRMDSRLARKLGYRVGSPSAARAAPFFWRQTHWLLLDPAAARERLTTVS